MIIAACYGQGEPEYATASAIVAALRNLGHTVIRVGPYYNYAPEWGVPNADVILEDRKFPEKYTYAEVLAKTGPIDLLFQIEPHFYITGPKPSGIRSLYYFTDPHRAGRAYYELADEGTFNWVVCGQPAYTDYFQSLKSQVFTMPVGFDSRREVSYVQETRCDISFCGETGRVGFEYPYEDDIGHYATKLPPLGDNLKFPAPHYDYAERAGLLTLLSQDFDIRIYKSPLGDKYMSAIQAGKIGFNRSLLSDVGLRCLEVLGAGRVLVTDYVRGLANVLGAQDCYATYNNFTRIFHNPFLLEYTNLRGIIVNLLSRPALMEKMKLEAQERAIKCIWENRIDELFDKIGISHV